MTSIALDAPERGNSSRGYFRVKYYGSIKGP